jgi:hypothetical protein
LVCRATYAAPARVHFDEKDNPDLSVHYGKKRCGELAIVFMRIRGNMSCERIIKGSSIGMRSADFHPINVAIAGVHAVD